MKETPKMQVQIMSERTVQSTNQENAKQDRNSYDSDTSDITEFTSATEIKERPSTATVVKNYI